MSEASPPDIQIKVNSNNSRRGGGGNIIHPLELDSSPAAGNQNQRQMPTASPFRQINQFKRWVPWLIPGIVIADTVLFIIIMYVNDCPKNSDSCIAGSFFGRFSFKPFKENPLLGPSADTLEKMGALDVSKVVDDHQGWRLITCIWLHGGVFHLLANMLSLLVIGIRLEQEFGFIRIGLLYVISGFGGSLLSALFLQGGISVGASGAVFGLLGGMLSELLTNWTIYANKIATLVTLVIIIVINLAVGILPHVDNFSHLGGIFSGFLLGFVFLMRPQIDWVKQRFAPSRARANTPKYKTYQLALWILSLILVVAGLINGLVLLLRGVNLNDHCSWCHYMSCVPTSRWKCDTKPVACMYEQDDDLYTVTCSNSGKNVTYSLDNLKMSQLRDLCHELCG
ncbi:RHOMBOID-like protein 2 [Bidens hawaiensis]|uniref:RHOMBOID-like protein 2 n=1 Tax=Bidens hawaiensis TaxID=980011 RepID=UPI004049902D